MNKNILKVSVLFLATVLFVGCSSTKQPQKITKNVVKTTKNTNGEPLWISNPNLNGNNGVVSIVSIIDKRTKKPKSKKKLRYIAKLKASAAFESKKGINIDSKSETKIKSDGTMSYKEKVKLKTNSIQTSKLVIKDTYKDKKNFYMWMVESK